MTHKQFSTVDWSNDDLFFTYTWSDETSEFDDHPTKRWSGGLECYTRKYKARVPVAFKDCPVLIDKFIILMEDYPEAEGFWVE